MQFNSEFPVHTFTVECDCRIAFALQCCFSRVKLPITPETHILLPLPHSHCCDNPVLTALLHLHRQVASSPSPSPNPALCTSHSFLFLNFPSFSLIFLPFPPLPFSYTFCTTIHPSCLTHLTPTGARGPQEHPPELLRCLFPLRGGILVFLAITLSPFS